MPKDFDRPLNSKGERASKVMGSWMRRERLSFDHVMASPAVRVIDTLDHVATGYTKRFDPVWDRRIYLASSATLMDVLREADDAHGHILMVGHNPGMEDMILDLVPDRSEDALREAVYAKFPTGSYARVAIDIDHWADIKDNIGRIEAFMRPRDLDSSLGPDNE